MDEMVYTVQNWLNANYAGRTGFNPVEPSGVTGWETMHGLTRALQIELGIATPSDSVGPTTLQYLTNLGPISMNSNTKTNIVFIIQGGMYCKGYNPTGFTGTFGSGTQSGISSMQSNLGIQNPDGVVTPKLFKALLNMDSYVLLEGGNPKIRSIQQWLNNKYINRKNFFYMPCDGYYSRDVQKSLIYGIQYEEGLDDATANGNFGPTTQRLIPTLNVNNADGTHSFVHLFQAAMIFNNFDVPFDGYFTTFLSNTVKDFQAFCMLPQTGIGDFQTWASLLQSTGDPTRKGTACDCVTEVTLARGAALKAEGYETVGRYLTNVKGSDLNKKIQTGELQNIFALGLTVFPIYQTYGGEASYFNKDQGEKDAQAAFSAGKKYGFKSGTTIYFSVDFDALGVDITNNILPHFQGINEMMTSLGGFYKVGIYGPRNVCIQVLDQGLASTSFVSGMSTGFSGNLGYPLPSNWAFDQISTITVGSGDGQIKIDNDIKSGRDNGVLEVEANDSVVMQLLNMAQNSYDDKELIGSWSPGLWELDEKYTDPVTSFTVYLYRKYHTDTGMYDYTFAFRGTHEPLDYLEDLMQVVGNVGGLQAQDAVDYVGGKLNSDRDLIHHVYFTGHSLGGYLAAWVQSEMVDENLPMVDSFTVTFNAPGLSSDISPGDIVQKAKVVEKMFNDKLGKYDQFIANYRINNDLVSAFGDDLGNVYDYDAILSPISLFYYHGIDRFLEVL
ncbi:MAG TPA: glycoside hydrolase domain-containing protein [Bacillales bacterium]|nr:glycoside hydrolase domain-containing protein [Bacillales bacterium]